MTGGALQLGYNSSFTTILTMQRWTRGCLLEHKMVRRTSMDILKEKTKQRKKLSVKTDSRLNGATGREVKEMHISQKDSSLVLLKLRFYTVIPVRPISCGKNLRKEKQILWKCHTYPQSVCCYAVWLMVGREVSYLVFVFVYCCITIVKCSS